MMQKSVRVLINALLAVFVLTSCGTSYYYAEFIYPSKVYIPAEVYRVGIANRAATAQSEAIIYTGGIPYDHIKGIPLKAVDKTINELMKNNQEIGRFEMVAISLPARYRKGKQFMEDPLPFESVDSICRALNLDALISIDGAEVSIRTRGSVEVVTAVDETGMPVKVPEFTNESLINYSIAWRFYDNMFKVLSDTYQESYQRVYTAQAFSEQQAMALGVEDLNMGQLAYMAGSDYFTRISPHWKEDYRLYYQTGNEGFYLVSKTLEVTGDWEMAYKGWKDFVDNPDDKIAYRAAYNLAVANEMMGDPRKAREYATKAQEVKNTKQVRNYLASLEKQILLYDVVNVQLGITEPE